MAKITLQNVKKVLEVEEEERNNLTLGDDYFSYGLFAYYIFD